MNLIQENKWIYLEDNRQESRIVKITKNKTIFWRKQKFDISELIDKEYNTFYKLDGKNKLQAVDESEFYQVMEADHQDVEITKNNKELFDKNDSQKLTQDDIQLLKQQEEGDEIVKKIINNSETFNQKTEYSQAKYVKKKKQKYIFCFIVQECNLMNIHKNIYDDSPAKINFMRIDTFAIFLQLCGIRLDSNILYFDNTYGLGLAGIAEKLDGQGKISVILQNKNKSNIKDLLPLVQMNFNENIMNSIQMIQDILNIQDEQYSHLLICGDFNYKEIFDKFNKQLKIGGILTVYSSFLEKLSELSELLIQSDQYCKVEIIDTFYRQIQVLENRTHPRVDMIAFGGYLLVAYKMI